MEKTPAAVSVCKSFCTLPRAPMPPYRGIRETMMGLPRTWLLAGCIPGSPRSPQQLPTPVGNSAHCTHPSSLGQWRPTHTLHLDSRLLPLSELGWTNPPSPPGERPDLAPTHLAARSFPDAINVKAFITLVTSMSLTNRLGPPCPLTEASESGHACTPS